MSCKARFTEVCSYHSIRLAGNREVADIWRKGVFSLNCISKTISTIDLALLSSFLVFIHGTTTANCSYDRLQEYQQCSYQMAAVT